MRRILVKGIGTYPSIGIGRVRKVETLDDLLKLQENEIVVVSKASRDMLSYLRKSSGVVTDYGGITSHVAIVLREFGVPSIVGTGFATEILKEGEIVTVDGNTGNVYKGFVEIKEKIEYQELYYPSTNVKVNINVPEIASKVAPYADGVGSVRIENIIIRTGKHPQLLLMEDRLTDVIIDGIRPILDAFYPKPVYFRTFDIPSDELKLLKSGDIEPVESNPLIGLRGIHKDLKNPEILKAQFKAVQNFLKEGYTNLMIKIPFIRDISEYKATEKIMNSIGLEPHQDVSIGVSVETPSVVFTFNEFLKEGIDFATIGMSDLTMCALAVDRRGVKVARHFQLTHPAVMKMVEIIIRKCDKAGIESCMTGYACSDPDIVKKLVELNINSISTNPDQILKMREIIENAENQVLLKSFTKYL